MRYRSQVLEVFVSAPHFTSSNEFHDQIAANVREYDKPETPSLLMEINLTNTIDRQQG